MSEPKRPTLKIILAKIEQGARDASKCTVKHNFPCPVCVATLELWWAEYKLRLLRGTDG